MFVLFGHSYLLIISHSKTICYNFLISDIRSRLKPKIIMNWNDE